MTDLAFVLHLGNSAPPRLPCGGVLFHSLRRQIMPTDLDKVSKRKREAQPQAQTEITTIMLVCLIICLGSLGLVFEIFGR